LSRGTIKYNKKSYTTNFLTQKTEQAKSRVSASKTPLFTPKLIKSGGFPKMEILSLCTSCHRNKTKDHPVINHPVSQKTDPRNNLPLTCLSCHQPHTGERLKLIKFSSCNECHK
jgi:hypothetical protein